MKLVASLILDYGPALALSLLAGFIIAASCTYIGG